MNKVVVLGSLNMDLVTTLARLPKVGETIIAKQLDYFVGGKGANQAVAASRIGGDVTMLGKIGCDTFGEKILNQLNQENLNLVNIEEDDQSFTGIANVFKLPTDNCITVVAGANGMVDDTYVVAHADIITEANVLLMQLEIPISVVKQGLSIAKAAGLVTILNPAPFSADVLDLLPQVDYLTPNELEFTSLLSDSLKALPFEEALLSFSEQYDTTMIVTRGAKGVAYVQDSQLLTVPTQEVTVSDTTGAGDTFNGILAQQLSRGESLANAISLATRGATYAITKFGAQTGMPTLLDLQAFQA
ncbi:ribokinase [Pseudolactococcus carnosus]|uniref:ribokinase n=1 Tax=Pseudolactococcus carnosus TaxID=2749961 RepID=UPI001FB96EA5|nr:ribokinase [Lactococcus carnosus]MCJ1979935.1 ribokinase [Lactococcus carnosus]